MNRDHLSDLEGKLIKEVVERRKVGGYSVEANGILFLAECVLAIIQHLKASTPEAK